VIFSGCLIQDNKPILPPYLQLLKSGTAIGANVEDALAAQSLKRFSRKDLYQF
jgi:hypothetical protein